MIRKGHPGDFADILRLLRLAHEESPRYSRLRWNERKAGVYTISHLTGGDDLVALVYEEEESVRGFLFARVGMHLLFDEKFAVEEGFFIEPSHRSLTTAQDMLRSYIEWAQDRSASTIEIGTSSGFRPSHAKKLFESVGFSHYGYLLEKRVEP